MNDEHCGCSALKWAKDEPKRETIFALLATDEAQFQPERHYELLLDTFTRDYLGKLYYYCLKKTDNPTEAEDLSADISLHIVTALRKGVVPQHFSAWVWRIAKNRYSQWAGAKSKRRSMMHGPGLDDTTIADHTAIDADLVHSEDLSLLRRELSFISKDYRDIVVAYYINDTKAQTIAGLLNIPKGTVVSKLFRARKILKEGMNMAREFGTKSYKPEDFYFSGTGNHPTGLPDSALNRQLPKNILLEAHNNPSSLEALAVEVGVALPYMEEEVQLLVDAELLMETKGKYVTAFLIESKELQLTLHNTQQKGSRERSPLVDDIATSALPHIRALGIVPPHYPNSQLKWLVATLLMDRVIDLVPGSKIGGFYHRKDGGDWGITGYEAHDFAFDDVGICHNGIIGDGGEIWGFTYPILNGNTLGKITWDNTNLPIFADIVKNRRNVKDFTAAENEVWQKVYGGLLHVDENGDIVPDIAVFTNGTIEQMHAVFEAHPKYAALQNLVSGLFDELKGILKKHSTPAIHDQLEYYASTSMLGIRGMAINDMVAAGALDAPEDVEDSTLGLYAVLH